MKHILKCQSCNKYTMNATCKCGSKAVSPGPAKYSPEDKYGSYRRQVKSKDWIKTGYL